jgi:hypothetical protein
MKPAEHSVLRDLDLTQHFFLIDQRSIALIATRKAMLIDPNHHSSSLGKT